MTIKSIRLLPNGWSSGQGNDDSGNFAAFFLSILSTYLAFFPACEIALHFIYVVTDVFHLSDRAGIN